MLVRQIVSVDILGGGVVERNNDAVGPLAGRGGNIQKGVILADEAHGVGLFRVVGHIQKGIGRQHLVQPRQQGLLLAVAFGDLSIPGEKQQPGQVVALDEVR